MSRLPNVFISLGVNGHNHLMISMEMTDVDSGEIRHYSASLDSEDLKILLRPQIRKIYDSSIEDDKMLVLKEQIEALQSRVDLMEEIKSVTDLTQIEEEAW